MAIRQDWVIPAYQADNWLTAAIRLYNPRLSAIQVRKALGRKDIRINGVRQNTDQLLHGGEKITCFWPDRLREMLTITSDEETRPAAARQSNRYFQLVYEDKYYLILNKTAGIAVHRDHTTRADEIILIDLVRAQWENAEIELCHRLDRNTSGLILLAKTAAALDEAHQLIKKRKLKKTYRCLVAGIPKQHEPDHDGFDTLTGWLEKDAGSSQVYIHGQRHSGDLQIITRYKVLRSFHNFKGSGEDAAEVEVELITGRTHQIRAHLASIGHPLIGDGKYGRNTFNRKFTDLIGKPVSTQQLCACRLDFPQPSDNQSSHETSLIKAKSPLAGLAGRTFIIDPVYDLDLDQHN